MIRPLLAFFCVIFALGVVCAEPLELPFEADLTAPEVLVDLRGSQIEVVYDPDAPATVEVSDLLFPDNSEGFVLVEQSEGHLLIGSPTATRRSRRGCSCDWRSPRPRS